MTGDQFSVQGNILAGPKVVEETFKAFKQAKGFRGSNQLATFWR
ncbi:MAG: hypothetical protein HY646_11040 [Acidobacteria bacterium]|nr:hypothetical protein [Acidobacteriota bacterium]